jgi:Flp pilus assembly protein TadD
MLFGLYPMHVESVAWVAERKDVLSGFFFLLTLLAYARYVEEFKIGNFWGGKAKWFYGACLILFALGLMSKPMLVTLPVILLLLDFWPLGRIQNSKFKIQNWKGLILEKLPFFVLSLASGLVTIFAQARGHGVVSVESFPLDARLLQVPVSYSWYFLKLFWPTHLSVFYLPDASVQESLAAPAGAVLLLVFISALALRLARKQPFILFGWLWFLFMLLPVIGILQVGSQVYADRYTYLPYIGLFIIVAWAVPAWLSQWSWHRPVLWIGAAIVLTACFQTTVAQVHYWQNARTLFAEAIVQDPNNKQAWHTLGLQYFNERNLDKAITCLQRATTNNLAYHQGWNDLGRILVVAGRNDEAQVAFETALLNGGEQKAEIYKNLGFLSFETGKFTEAIAHLQNSVALDERQVLAHTFLGKAYLATGQPATAALEFQTSIRLQPDNPEAELGLAACYSGTGQLAEAIAHCRRVLELDPDSCTALNNLAWVLATASDSGLRNGAEAVRLAGRACQLTQNQTAMYLGTLAAAYAEVGQFDDALVAAQKACDLAEKTGQTDLLKRNRQLMELYRAHQPVRE